MTVLAFNLAGSPFGMDLLVGRQPLLIMAWQTSVAVLLGFFEATHQHHSALTPDHG